MNDDDDDDDDDTVIGTTDSSTSSFHSGLGFTSKPGECYLKHRYY